MLETIYPQNDFLKKYISYIYRFFCDDPLFERQLVIFPNVGSAIAIYQDVDFYATGYQQFVSLEKEGGSGTVLQLNRIDPVTIKEVGRQRRIVVVLEPLGINQFIGQQPGELVKSNNPSLIPITHLLEELAAVCKQVVEQPLQESAPLIEEILLKSFRSFSNPLLENTLAEINRADRLVKIEDIARRVGASPKTINRLFQKHIGLNAVVFRKISQFRKAVGDKLFHPSESLTSIAWANSYYDLPYMIKVFKELTGFNVNEFFSKLSYTKDLKYLYIG